MSAINYVLNFNDTSKTGLALSFSVFNQVTDNASLTAPSILELGSGFYKFSYDISPLSSDIYYVATDLGSNVLTGTIALVNLYSINDLALRILGLNHENIFIDELVYDGNSNLVSSRVRTYSTATDVGTNTNVIATYNMTSTYTGNNLDTFQVVTL